MVNSERKQMMYKSHTRETSTTMEEEKEVLVKVEKISKKFCRSLKRSLWYGAQDITTEITGQKFKNTLREDEFWAVKDVSFDLRRGECMGLIGHNGAGKTTLLKMLNGLIKPDRGKISIKGRVGALISLGTGFNPILTGRENIYVSASILGISKNEINEKIDEIIEFSEIGEFIDTPVQNYSSGMQVRLGFSIAINIKPDVLLIDEVLAVGDLGFKQKAYAAIYEIIQDTAVIFVSHSISQIGKVCNRGILMKKGKVGIESFHIKEVIDAYFSEFNSHRVCQVSGSGQAKLVKFEVSSKSSGSTCKAIFTPDQLERKATVTYSERLKCVFTIEIDNSVKYFYVGITFNDMEMKGIAQSISINCTEIFKNNTQNVCEIIMNIPSIHLNKGQYEMNLYVNESKSTNILTGKSLCLYENLLKLQVLSGSLMLGRYPVQLDANWKSL